MDMKFVKGLVVGGLVTTEMMKKGKKFVKKMGIM